MISENMIEQDARSFPVTAFVLNDNGSYGQYAYSSYLEAADDLRSETIIAIIADTEVMDVEITYSTARAYDCKDHYSKSIFWNRKNSGMTLDELTEYLGELEEYEG